MFISTLGCNLPGQTHGMPRILHFDSRVRNFGPQVANKNKGFFHSPTALLPAFSCGTALLWDCIPNPHAPLLSPFPHLCLDAFPLHYETSLYHTFFETVMGTMNGVCEYQSNIQFISRPEH